MFLAMEGGIWYFTGREGISRYGLPAAVAAGAAAAVRLLQLRMSGGKKYKKEPAAGPVDITAAPEFKYDKTENVLNPVIKRNHGDFSPKVLRNTGRGRQRRIGRKNCMRRRMEQPC